MQRQLAPLEGFLRAARTFGRGEELGTLVEQHVAELLSKLGLDGTKHD